MLDKNYNFKGREECWSKHWQDEGIYKFDPESVKEIFSIDTPPPTVSGKMHIGHSSSYAQQDFIARYQRMTGKNVFYPFGTDDNGLPTERLVEKLKGVKATKMERSEFIDLCKATLKEILPEFIQDWKKLGISSDFGLYYSTIDDNSRKISQQSFIDLYNKERAYQLEAPVVWCPTCQTAISQVEMEDEEHETRFCDIIFKVDNKDLVISTTRPELLSSCAAIFVNADDKRYTDIVGKKATVPLFNHEVPILTDRRAQIDKGTGAVMCCTFGDSTDIEWYKAHKLPLVLSIDETGHMTDKAGKYQGMTAKEAREAIITDLESAGLKTGEKKITHSLNVHERCKTPVEIINSKQWFIKYLDLKDEFLKAGMNLAWHPDFMKSRLKNWIEGLQWDWCISRQRFFGVPFPVWHCEKCGEVKLADSDSLPVDPTSSNPTSPCKCGSNDFRPELDVLDTWATSSLTPQIASSLVAGKIDKDKLFPMSLRPQAHDIISFWLFNTLAKSMMHEGKAPWADVMISGWVLDPQGRKMSKSLGNVVEPQAVLDNFGADAIRFWASGNSLGQDNSYTEEEIKVGKRTVTKLWNACGFALAQLDDFKYDADLDVSKLEDADRWILGELNTAISEYRKAFDKYEYNKAREIISKFFWDKYCDNYIEFIKYRLYSESNNESNYAARWTLHTVVENILKMFAPIMPFVTEEIYSAYFAKLDNVASIHNTLLPDFDEKYVFESESFAKVLEIVASVRKYRSENSLSFKKEIEKITISDKEKENLSKYEEFILKSLNISTVEYASEDGLMSIE